MTRPIDMAIEVAGTQNELSRMSNVSQACISKLHSGITKEMELETARKISKATGIPIIRLIPSLGAEMTAEDAA